MAPGVIAPAILVLSQAGLPIAQRIAAALPGSRIHGLAGRIAGADATLANFGDGMRALFAAGNPVVALCAAGIVIRTLAPLLSDKRAEPPVLAVAEDGSAVVPLLGGLSGVNVLARSIAAALGVDAAVTTAGDLEYGLTLENPPPGYTLADAAPAKRFTADLLAGAAVRLEAQPPAALPEWLARSGLPLARDGGHCLLVTPWRTAPAPDQLVYHPRCAVIAVAPDTAPELIIADLECAGVAWPALAAVIVPEASCDAAWLDRLEAAVSCPVRLVPDAGTLELLARHVTRARDVWQGAGGVLAIAPAPLALEGLGRDRGRLSVVGLGPGAAHWLTPQARAALLQARSVHGYGPYLDQARSLLGRSLPADQIHHASDNREELERARTALEEAAMGLDVAIVSSGDPGIFAMAAALFEVLEAAEPTLVRIAILPGITAAQAAAAHIGAPLGHDFCVVSLSDRLKPWDVIERRLEAAAAGDLVLALYNPLSRARPWQLAKAQQILLRWRTPQTPVMLARAVGRAGESHRTVTLGTLDPAMVDMATLVIVGSSETRCIDAAGRRWTYTPRHYGRSHGPEEPA